MKLVERTGKLLELTEAGQLLYKHALNIVKLLEESQIEVKETGSGLRGKLSMGVNTLSSERLPKLLRIFQSRYPNITYRIQQNESAQLCKLVRERAIELAIIRMPLELSDFHVLPLATEPFYYVTSNQYPHESGSPISLAQIQKEPLIVPSTEGLGLYQMIVDAFSRRGFTPNVTCECSDIHILLELVASGFGSTLVPGTVLKHHQGYDVQALEIEGAAGLEASSALIWLKQHYLSQTAQHFIELLKENVRN